MWCNGRSARGQHVAETERINKLQGKLLSAKLGFLSSELSLPRALYERLIQQRGLAGSYVEAAAGSYGNCSRQLWKLGEATFICMITPLYIEVLTPIR